MDSYRASKVWHLGQEIAREVHAVVKQLPDDGSNLPGYMRKSSVSIPMHVASSISKKKLQEKLDCYVNARQAAIDLTEHLKQAKDVKYIESEVFKELASKTIEAQNLLTILIRKTHYDMAAAKE